MHVASKDLCAELYELSRWRGDGRMLFTEDDDGSGLLKNYLGSEYTLAYLLRKLPPHCPVATKTDGSAVIAYYNAAGEAEHYAHADTPEDAACHLAITLFKRGVLKNKHKGIDN